MEIDKVCIILFYLPKKRLSLEAVILYGEQMAFVNSFEELHSEIEKILISDKLVENWTYPLIQPILIEEAKKRGFI